MIRFKLTTSDGDVLVSLDSEQPHKVAPISYQGQTRGVLMVKRWLHYETGVYGQQICDWTAPIDLEAAMKKPAAAKFGPVMVEKSMGIVMKKANGESEG